MNLETPKLVPVKRPYRKNRRRLPPGQKLILVVLALAGMLTALLFLYGAWNEYSRQKAQAQAETKPIAPPDPFFLANELEGLSLQLNLRFGENKQTAIPLGKKSHVSALPLKPGVFVVEPATGIYADFNGRNPFPAASIIKLPVLVNLAIALQEGRVSLNQQLTIRKDLIGGGSGFLQWRKPGSKISLKDTAELMMIISDNTATNMIIDVLGGAAVCNKAFAEWGMSKTRINNWLPDLGGTNMTSPYDLVLLLGRLEKGEIVTPEMRTWMYSIMARNKIRTLLPMGVPAGTVIYDKTGDIGRMVGDAGIINTANGHRYIVAIQVLRPHNDRRANQLIRELSKDIYVSITGDSEGVKELLQPAKPKPRVRHHRRHHRR